MPARKAEVHLDYATARRGVPSPVSFRRWVEAALTAARYRKSVELSIRIVGEREGHALNWRYRNKDRATDVLSFPAEVPRGVTTPLLGDLVICAPVVTRAARELRIPPKNHYAHLTIHGVLHLLGHDHHEAKEAARMKVLEIHSLAVLDIPDPYRAWAQRP
ncbi:MAG: rRNA maturation RNase YbeY [Vicinamibacterales bacterium]